MSSKLSSNSPSSISKNDARGNGDRRAGTNSAGPGHGRPRASSRLISRASSLVMLLVCLILIGTVGFRYTEGWGWFKALYATLMTVATIGADPLNQLSPQGQMFNALLIVLGVSVVGFAIGSLTQAMVEFELGSFFGRRRMEKEISKLHDHFIVCGAGRVGRRIATEIMERELPVVMIEKDPGRAQWVRDHGIPLIVGDGSSEATLREAHIGQARGLASAVTSDAQNVYIVLTARGLAPDLFIIARASEEDADSKLLRAGASAVISPYNYAGESMARMMTRPHVQSFLDSALSSFSQGGLNLQMEEVRVEQGSHLAGASLAESAIGARLGIIVMAIRKPQGGVQFNPGSDHVISVGDIEKLRQLETLAGPG